MKNFNRIVFYGCSFTVGSELSDSELYPELSVEEIRRLKVKKGYEFYHKFDDVVRNKLDNPKAWPRWFCDELDIAWDNRAVSGSSTGAMIFNIERDLSNGSIKDIIKETEYKLYQQMMNERAQKQQLLRMNRHR